LGTKRHSSLLVHNTHSYGTSPDIRNHRLHSVTWDRWTRPTWPQPERLVLD